MKKILFCILIAGAFGMLFSNAVYAQKSTEDEVLKAVLELPEVQKIKDVSAMIASDPTEDEPYYAVKVGNNMETHFATIHWFYVYTKPEFEIKYYDVVMNQVLTLDEWRKTLNKDVKNAISDLPEVQKLEDAKIVVVGEPTDNEPYYTVKVGYDRERFFPVIYRFHVYTKPEMKIKYFYFVNDKELTLDEWRKTDDSKYNENADYRDYMDAYVIVADSSQNYYTLRDKMFQLSKSLNEEIDTMRRVYDESKNLICFPADDEEELFAGEYFPRRYPSETLSLEYQYYYEKNISEENKTMVLVTMITEDKQEAESKLKQIRKYSKNAFIIKSRIFVGSLY